LLAPRAAQALVPWVRDPSSPARWVGPLMVAALWWSRIEARSASANRAWTAVCRACEPRTTRRGPSEGHDFEMYFRI